MGSYYLYNLWAKVWNARNDQECRAKGLPTFGEWLDEEEPWEEFHPFTFTLTPDGEMHKTYMDNPKGGRR